MVAQPMFVIALRTVLMSLWLPLLVLVVSFARFGLGFWTAEGPGLDQIAMLFVFAWPAAISLTLAVLLLYPTSHTASWLCGALLGPLTVLAVIVGGLFGPPGVFIYAAVVSLPAWVVLLVFRLRQRRHQPAF